MVQLVVSEQLIPILSKRLWDILCTYRFWPSSIPVVIDATNSYVRVVLGDVALPFELHKWIERYLCSSSVVE